MSVAALSKTLGTTWPAIAEADVDAMRQREKLGQVVAANGIDSPDISVVAFGSIARHEWTAGSDLDWTMLIDGEADHRHANTANRLAELLKGAEFREPGTTGTFGRLTFSHGLLHQIGGQDDSNKNTTQRLLFLLESACAHQREAYDRVIEGILNRYLQNDFRPFRLKVPRFLNDLHRFWRTMCVDYASKYRDQAGKKWALRNIKLRMSRKLIFASGLLMCYSCDPDWLKARNPDLASSPSVEGLAKHLRSYVLRTPLDILATAVAEESQRETAVALFGAYDTFLAYLNDNERRRCLEDLPAASAAEEPAFTELQAQSDVFEDALERLFFDDSPLLAKLTRKHGVF